MSESKVLHEATIRGKPVRVVERDSGVLRAEVKTHFILEPYRGLVDPYVTAEWIDKLAARVRELEDECAGLLMERGKLKGRTEQLEAAVRWAWNRTAGNTTFISSLWLKTHPIVRSIIEKGGEQ